MCYFLLQTFLMIAHSSQHKAQTPSSDSPSETSSSSSLSYLSTQHGMADFSSKARGGLLLPMLCSPCFLDLAGSLLLALPDQTSSLHLAQVWGDQLSVLPPKHAELSVLLWPSQGTHEYLIIRFFRLCLNLLSIPIRCSGVSILQQRKYDLFIFT